VGEVGGIVEGGLASVVEGVQGDVVLEQDVDHHILAVVAGNVEGGAAIGVDGIGLQGWNMYVHVCMHPCIIRFTYHG
jgi:hypothetical protein